MDNIEKLKIDFAKTRENDEMVEIEPHFSGWKNEPEREKIRKKYINLLPKNKRLAIYLHDKLCNCSHTDMCSWSYEIHELDDDWNSYEHRKYLKKANNILEVCNDEILIMNIIDVIK